MSNPPLTAEQVISMLGLRPLPIEGGYYAETYRAGELPGSLLSGKYRGSRPLGTAIYYLLTPDTISAMHRLPGDEIFHHYHGDPVEQLHLLPHGIGRTVILGPDLAAGQRPQVIVPGGAWQGARLLPETHGFALLGTTMSPGFDPADYEPGLRDQLAAAYPDFADAITARTAPDSESK